MIDSGRARPRRAPDLSQLRRIGRRSRSSRQTWKMRHALLAAVRRGGAARGDFTRRYRLCGSSTRSRSSALPPRPRVPATRARRACTPSWRALRPRLRSRTVPLSRPTCPSWRRRARDPSRHGAAAGFASARPDHAHHAEAARSPCRPPPAGCSSSARGRHEEVVINLHHLGHRTRSMSATAGASCASATPRT
jgi:hypothetical protein